MRAYSSFGAALFVSLWVFGSGCGGTMRTGTAKRPVNNKPAADGTCPSGQSVCGTGLFASCVDPQTDPNHCGICDRVCSPGIACEAGVCQQTMCTGTTVPLSGQPTSGPGTLSASDGVVSEKNMLADVNGDGWLDRIEWITVLDHCQSCGIDLDEFRVSLGQPGGTFGAPDTYQASDVITRIFAADVNSDGMADLYVVSSTWTNAAVGPCHVELWLGQKDGHLVRSDAAGMNVDAVWGWGSEIAMADLSGDGWPDLVMGAPETDSTQPPKIDVYLSDSTGALHRSQTFVGWSLHTFIRDWNGDGSPDLALLSGNLEMVYNRGDGTFEPPVDCALSVGGGSAQEEDLLAEDFNGDGWIDLAGVDIFTSRVGVMLGLGGCGFGPISYYDTPGSSTGYLRAAELNGDGILDIVSVNVSVGASGSEPADAGVGGRNYLLSVLIGNSDGTFHLQDPAISLGPDVVSDVTIGEITGDDRPDIIVSSVEGRSPQTSAWENTCQ